MDIKLSEELMAEAETDPDSVKEKISESKSFLSIAYITQYFDPESSIKLGYNNYNNARWIQTGLFYGDARENMVVTLQQTQCTYYDNIALDMSQFGSIFGTECDTYIVTD